MVYCIHEGQIPLQARSPAWNFTGQRPWPFPDSLMIGFTADYDSGEIEIDPVEIIEAGWFKARDLPLIPDAYTLAGQLIRDYVTEKKK